MAEHTTGGAGLPAEAELRPFWVNLHSPRKPSETALLCLQVAPGSVPSWKLIPRGWERSFLWSQKSYWQAGKHLRQRGAGLTPGRSQQKAGCLVLVLASVCGCPINPMGKGKGCLLEGLWRWFQILWGFLPAQQHKQWLYLASNIIYGAEEALDLHF